MAMGKQAARKLVESETLSISDFRAMIASARGTGRMSTLNPQFTLDQTCDIFERALEGRDGAEVPKALRPDPYSPSGRLKPTRDALTMSNICRDCGPPAKAPAVSP